jgi:hypothetical protein
MKYWGLIITLVAITNARLYCMEESGFEHEAVETMTDTEYTRRKMAVRLANQDFKNKLNNLKRDQHILNAQEIEERKQEILDAKAKRDRMYDELKHHKDLPLPKTYLPQIYKEKKYEEPEPS